MSAPESSSEIPLRKLGWVVIAFVLTAPTLFFALVAPRPDEEPAPPAKIERPPSKLAAVGLRENRDWDGLPEIFAIWESKAHWQGNRTRFAYWHPGTQSFGYYLEARRTTKGIRFKEIPEPSAAGFGWDTSAGDDVPIRFYVPASSLPPE